MKPHPTHTTRATRKWLLSESRRLAAEVRARRIQREQLPALEEAFSRLGWSDSAAGELALIHIAGGQRG